MFNPFADSPRQSSGVCDPCSAISGVFDLQSSSLCFSSPCCRSYSLPVFLPSGFSFPRTSGTEGLKQKKKSDGKNPGSGKENKSVKIPVIILDVYEKLKELEEEAEKEGDDQKLRDITCVKKGLMWIGEVDGEGNSIELWERRMTLVHEALSLE